MAFYRDERALELFIRQHSLSMNQFDLLWKLYNRDIPALLRIMNEGVGAKYLVNTEMKDLIAKEYLVDKSRDKSDFNIDEFWTTPKIEKLFKLSGEAFNQIYQAFPEYLFISNNPIPARTGDLDELRKLYLFKINKNLILHEKYLLELKMQVEQGLINMTLDKWIRSEMWNLDTVNKPQQSGKSKFI